MLITSSVMFAQTLAERLEITRNYDQEKLATMAAEYTSQDAIEKQKALDLAAINGWEEIIEMPNGGLAELVGVYENGNPRYLVSTNREGGCKIHLFLFHLHYRFCPFLLLDQSNWL